ncbi:hypothetical protein [Methylosinus sporium]|uniref:hypothetical protein n=1 Tax=Methylosinus sporium TaxID=428 RepID=UPI001FCE5CD4|nr:hypothetical protein [Methylosinus sporium]
MSMTSSAITFDRLAYIDRLKEAGFDDKQARAQADALDAALRDSVATKADLEELAGELRTEMANLKVIVSAGWSSRRSRSAASFSPPSNS